MSDSLWETLFNAAVHAVATLSAAVLSHPAMQEAASNVMVLGMNRFITQPDLDVHMRIMSDTLAKQQEDVARTAGQDFPKLVKNFVQGMIAKDDKPEHKAIEQEQNADGEEATDNDIVHQQQQNDVLELSELELHENGDEGLRKRTTIGSSDNDANNKLD